MAGSGEVVIIRAAIISLALTSPATAWEFTAGQPCILTHQTQEVAVKLIYDPTKPLYMISLKQAVPFTRSTTFSIFFLGDLPSAINTNNHRLSVDGKTLTVTDSGFGNVLDGLQYNDKAVATMGDLSLEIPLTDAAGPVAAFRDCDAKTPSV